MSDMPSHDRATFSAHLSKAKRIIAVLGAGLSASSGLPTFRGAGGYWRKHDATVLATPRAFRDDPGLVWQFYSYRRHMALNAKPNRAHLALAELARKKPGFMAASQNVDGLSTRAGHPEDQLKLIHGSLFDVKCWDEDNCGYIRRADFSDPIVPALALPEDEAAVDAILSTKAAKHDTSRLAAAIAKKHKLIKGVDISDDTIPVPTITRDQLPQCPQCTKELLRPGVVWFGESLPPKIFDDVEDFLDSEEIIDLCLVVGTSSLVYPAAGFSERAKRKGARIAVFNMDKGDAKRLNNNDWFFEGDAAELLPELLYDVIGVTPSFDESPQSAPARS